MSTLNVSNITDGTTTVGTSYVVNGSAKAWVNMNGQGTIAIRDSMNVASLTDVGTGQQRANYTSAMSSSDYSISLAATNNIGVNFEMDITLADGQINPSYVQWFTSVNSGTSLHDNSLVFAQSFGDLA
jgi:hypothetical protein